MSELPTEDELLISQLHTFLGDAYRDIIRGILNNYRVISLEPVRLRLKDRTETGLYDIGIDPNGPRFFYLYSALTSQEDAFGKSKASTVKYNAHKAMLDHYYCGYLAVKEGWMRLIAYYPSELDKMCQKMPHIFKVEHSNPPSPKAVKVRIINPGFEAAKMLEGWTTITDPYQFSDDDMPRTLPKPIAEFPPHVQQVKQFYAEKENNDHPWDLIPDEE